MISRTPEARMLYNARLKFQRDAESCFRGARQEGLEQGVLAGRIQLLQQLLRLPESSVDELAGYTASQRRFGFVRQNDGRTRERSDAVPALE